MNETQVEPTLIAHIVYSLDTGGLENGLVNLINRGTNDEFKHMVICLTNSGRFSRRITVANVPIIELRKPAGHSLKTYRQLRRIIQRYRPQIIHSRNLAALESQVATLGLLGVRRVHGEHGRDINDPQGTNWKYNALRRVSRLWIHQYFAVSRELSEWLTGRIGVPQERIVQQCNGVDCRDFSPRSGVNDPLPEIPSEFSGATHKIIGTVGRLVPIKDQITLIRAFSQAYSRLSEQGISAKLLIVGDGPLKPSLQREAEDLGIAEHCWFTGDRSDVNALLKRMDVFVLPSIAEGVSNTLLEAMATGLPVISTAVGGAPDIIEPSINGHLVSVGDTHAIASLIAKILSDSENSTLGDRARDKVDSEYSWPVTINRYLEVYRSLLINKSENNTKPQWH
ncbi:MAG: TIGR03088 family PEP-CTERM/XrtA system glycosyltransferase [Cellvibrionaceae bacterium]